MQDNIWNKSEALDNLIKMLKQPNTCETLEPGPASLLFEALFACQHLDKLHFLADVSIFNYIHTWSQLGDATCTKPYNFQKEPSLI